MLRSRAPSVEQGTTLIEVLITLLILAFGLLGLAGMQSHAQKMEFESFQRSQAVMLLSEMTDRINANRANAPDYVTTGTTTIGTDDTPVDCTTMVTRQTRDTCEWSSALRGAGETLGTSKVGAMVGARGCILRIQAEDAKPGICTPAIYQVTVAWQGLYSTKTQFIPCGKDLYGKDDRLRRAISSQLTVGLPNCS